MKNNVRILIVDDEYEKVKLIGNLIEEDVELESVTNSKDAVKKLTKEQYDVLIIDLQIPDMLGAEINEIGGKELLEYLQANDDVYKPAHILGITSHQDSYDECKKTFYESGWSLLKSTDDPGTIKKILKAKINYSLNPPQNYDIAILTALPHVELEAVLDLPCDWIPINFEDDCNIYYSTVVTTSSGKEISIITTSCSNMGIANASAITMKLALKYKPEYIFMTGISAGIEGKVALGDILVASICWDWGSGKQTIEDGKPTFKAAPNQVNMHPTLKSKFDSIATNRNYIDDIYRVWKANKPPTTLNVHVGPLASGAVVLEDPAIVDMIKSQHRNLIGVEMEAYGVAVAAELSADIAPKVIIIKSVCDFADPEKNDKWQPYAAYTSTNLAYQFILNELF